LAKWSLRADELYLWAPYFIKKVLFKFGSFNGEADSLETKSFFGYLIKVLEKLDAYLILLGDCSVT